VNETVPVFDSKIIKIWAGRAIEHHNYWYLFVITAFEPVRQCGIYLLAGVTRRCFPDLCDSRCCQNYAGYGNKNENLSIHDQPYLLNGFLLVLLKITIDNGLM
jgi:hypothetical protein